jgi:hypothetical protein
VAVGGGDAFVGAGFDSELEHCIVAALVLGVDDLADMIARHTPQTFEQNLTATASKLQGYFEDPMTLNAMSELDAIDRTYRRDLSALKQAQRAEIARLVAVYSQNRERLLQRIEDYRARSN